MKRADPDRLLIARQRGRKERRRIHLIGFERGTPRCGAKATGFRGGNGGVCRALIVDSVNRVPRDAEAFTALWAEVVCTAEISPLATVPFRVFRALSWLSRSNP